MKEVELIINNKAEFLKYLKAKFPLIHDSNVFFRDLHYGVMDFLEEKLKRRVKYLDAEKITHQVVTEFEKQGIFKKMDNQTWLLNYPEFALPRVTPAAKSAATAPAAQAAVSAAGQAAKESVQSEKK